MKLAFSTIGCPEWSLDEMITKGAAYGFGGVELRTHKDGNHFPPEASLETARETGERFRDGGLPVLTILGYSRFAFEDEATVRENAKLLAKLIDLAEAFEVPYVRVMAGIIPKGADRNVMIETVSSAFRPLAQKALDQGVTLVMETHDDWCSAGQVLPVVERVDSPAFRLIYDIFNAIESGIEPWEETYAKIKDHIAYCHIKDGYINLHGNPVRSPLGAGDFPLHEFFSRLKADGYDGFLSFEWEKKWAPELEPPERVFPQAVHKIQHVWDSI